MASLESAQGKNVYSITTANMVSNTALTLNPTSNPALANFFLGTSRILGLVRVSANGGTISTPYIKSITATGSAGAAAVVTIVINASGAGDTSNYILTWVNEIANNSAQLNA